MSQGYTKGNPIDVDGTLSANSDFLLPSQKAVKTYADNGLATKQDTLTGSESVLLPTRLLFKQNTTIAHTGVTGETVIATYLVAGNTIQANDILKWLLYYTMTSNANAKEVKCYFNTSADLSGTPIQVAVRNVVSTSGAGIGRELVSNNSQTQQIILNHATSFQSTEANTAITVTTRNIDFTVAQYFVITANLAVGTDTITLQQLHANLMR